MQENKNGCFFLNTVYILAESLNMVTQFLISRVTLYAICYADVKTSKAKVVMPHTAQA